MTTRIDSDTDHRIVRLYQDLQAAAQRFWSTPHGMVSHQPPPRLWNLSLVLPLTPTLMPQLPLRQQLQWTHRSTTFSSLVQNIRPDTSHKLAFLPTGKSHQEQEKGQPRLHSSASQRVPIATTTTTTQLVHLVLPRHLTHAGPAARPSARGTLRTVFNVALGRYATSVYSPPKSQALSPSMAGTL